MARGEEPYCLLSDGSPVFVSTLAEFYLSIPGIDVRSEPQLRPFFDTSERMRLFDLFVQRMYVLPGFVIDV